MPKPYTSEQIVDVLDEMGFHLARRNGSHAIFKYKHPEDDDEKRTVVVPLHKDPIATGTLREISKQAGANDFKKFCDWVDGVLDEM